MMELMKGWTTALFSEFVLLTAPCSGQTPAVPAGHPHYIEIRLPASVISESFIIRYALMGEDFGGWIQPLAGVSSYVGESGTR
jgi:hypothetical protein